MLLGSIFLRENELFEKKHLLKAIENLIPGCSLVDESNFLFKDLDHPLMLLYLEIEKESGFSKDDLSSLK